MWCITSTSRCAVSPVRSRPTRSSGPFARSKGVRTRRAASSRTCAGWARRSASRRSSTASGDTVCCGTPSSLTPKRVRSDGCRATSACRLARSAAWSSAPCSVSAAVMCCAVLSGSICQRNHWRACAYEAGRGAPGTAAGSGTIGRRPKSMPCARNAAMNSFCRAGGKPASRWAMALPRSLLLLLLLTQPPRLSNNASMRSRSLSACAACCACAGPCASSACAHAARSGSSK
ncbi:hypothetical protein D3C87_986920 [compost metagenome]